MNGLVVVLARPGLRIAPKINADEPGARSTRNNLSCLSGDTDSPDPERGTQLAHLCGGDQVSRELESGVVDRGIQLPRTGTPSISIRNVKEASTLLA